MIFKKLFSALVHYAENPALCIANQYYTYRELGNAVASIMQKNSGIYNRKNCTGRGCV